MVGSTWLLDKLSIEQNSEKVKQGKSSDSQNHPALAENRRPLRIPSPRRRRALRLALFLGGAFRHPPDYRDYPFDQEAVWIRIWPKDLRANTVLVPDLSAHPCPTQPERPCPGIADTFAMESTLVLDEYEQADTCSDHMLSSYSSGFGIDVYVGQTGFPELRFNKVLRRLLEDATTLNTVQA